MNAVNKHKTLALERHNSLLNWSGKQLMLFTLRHNFQLRSPFITRNRL